MPEFNSMKELEKYLNKKIQDSLRQEVSEVVKDVMQDKVESEVYDVYRSYSDHPDAYIRRGEDGGLKDRGNIESNVEGNVLEVENVARMQDTGYKLAGLIEYGDKAGHGEYDYRPAKKSQGDFRQPRPFLKSTEIELEQTGKHVDAMKKGLQRQGLDIE